MRVWSLGTGDAFSAERYSTCLLIEHEDTRILVDCPHPIRKILRESTKGRVDVGDIDALVLTHLHGDHASGLEGYAWFCRFVLGRPARLVAHPAVLAQLWPQLQASMSELLHVDDDNRPHHRTRLVQDDLWQTEPLKTETPHRIGCLTVEARMTVHHIPTTALFFRADDGTSFGYSADTAFDPGLIAWLDRADVVVHETNLGAHTPYAKLVGLPSTLRDKMRLVHWPDGFDVGHDGAIALLHDGDGFEIVDSGKIIDVAARLEGQR
jgi:ribonuclease BN (tRNA processing enzyme)